MPARGFGHERPLEGATNTWLTPKELIDWLGPFDLDPCAAPAPRPWDTARVHYDLTQGQDGLSLPWFGRVFCNPPYGPHSRAWMERLADHGNGLALIFARVETRAWQSIIWPNAAGVLFPHRRIRFCRPDGTHGEQPGAPSALVAFGKPELERLRASGIKGALVQLCH